MTAIVKKKFWNNKIVLGFSLALAAAGLSFAFQSSPAFAVGDGGVGQPPPITSETGGPGNNGGGADPSVPNKPKPSDGRTGWRGPSIDGAIYKVDCSSWGGTKSWKESSSCSMTEAQIKSKAPGTKESWGYEILKSGYQAQFGTYVDNEKSCAPSGNKSAYAKNWRKVDSPGYETPFTWEWSRGFQEWIKVWLPRKQTGLFVIYYAENCLYPNTVKTNKICFWNYNGGAWYSKDRKVAAGSWTKIGTRGVQKGDPKQPSGGTGKTAPSCDREGTANVRYADAVDNLGYYRVNTSYSYRNYSKTAYVIPGGREVYRNWSRGAVLGNSNNTWWTYTCQPGGGNPVRGPWSAQGSLPNVDRYTNPATCPQVSWQCVLETPTTIGLDRTAVVNGSLSPTTRASVMRNGQKVNIDFARVRIIDTSTSRNITVTDGQKAPSIRNVSNIAYKTTVVPGSTPFLGKDANATSQYFKYYNSRSNTTKEKFGSWINQNNSNVNKAISFNWASESSSEAFKVAREYKVTAEFYVPGGSSVGTGGAGASPGYQWKKDTYACREYKGRGASRTDVGPLVSTSNPVEVVRSVNQ